MAHFAELKENNIVVRVIVVNNLELLENGQESEQKGIDFCKKTFGGHWIQTSYNKSFRKRFASIGMIYDEKRDAFLEPQPFNSWTLDENLNWQPPTPYPDSSTPYTWDEASLSWVEIPLAQLGENNNTEANSSLSVITSTLDSSLGTPDFVDISNSISINGLNVLSQGDTLAGA